MTQELARDKDDFNRTEWSIREHLTRAYREPRPDVKPGSYAMENAPTWKPRSIPKQATAAKGYSRDPKKCSHQFASNRMACPYCATTNPNWKP